MKAKITITDDKGNIFEGVTDLIQVEKNSVTEEKHTTKSWFKPNSTVSRIIDLINDGFFSQNKTITEIITQLESKDYHYKASDLTLPLRNIVRKGLLTRGRIVDKNQTKWSYMKANK